METKLHIKLASLLCLIQLCVRASCGTQFSSHVSVSTPTRTFVHGVGDPLPSHNSRGTPPQHQFRGSRRPIPPPPRHPGYQRLKPTIPFNNEELYREPAFGSNYNARRPWAYNDIVLPVLPVSPYRVDSPDPESLWPEGLFLPPLAAPRLRPAHRHSVARADDEAADPYLLEGSEAVAAVARADRHGELYFHDIPHIESLLANQELRIKNNLKPHVLGSIRHTWPYYRP